MKQNLNRVLGDTKKVLSTRWSASELRVPAWVVNAIIYITVLRSLSYGLELFILGSAAAVNPISSFVAVLGISTWGFLIVLGVVVLLIGLILRNAIIVTFGALLCSAVWVGLSLVLCVGWIDYGSGGRFAIAALCTAATWAVFFFVQLKAIRINGVET
jgi:hypothetical protein